MIKLQWKRRKDGTVYATHKKVAYTVSKTTARLGLYPIYNLTVGGRLTASFAGEEKGKEACKRTAGRLAAGAKPLFPAVLKSLGKASLRTALTAKIEVQDNAFWNGANFTMVNLPRVKGPGYEFFRKQAAKGLTPVNVLVNPTLVAKGKLDKGNLDPDYLASLYIELAPLWLPVVLKEERILDREWEVKRQKMLEVQKKADDKRIAAEAKREEGQEKFIKKERKSYRKAGMPKPKYRANLPLRKIITPIAPYPDVSLPKSAKWIAVFRWGEGVRQGYADKGYYITYGGLANMARTTVVKVFKSNERRERFLRRLKIVYAEDADEERLQMVALIAEVNRKAASEARKKLKEKEAKGKDAFGAKLGSDEARINAVLSARRKSLARIKLEADVDGKVLPHLLIVMGLGFLKKSKGGTYRLTKRGIKARKSKK